MKMHTKITLSHVEVMFAIIEAAKAELGGQSPKVIPMQAVTVTKEPNGDFTASITVEYY